MHLSSDELTLGVAAITAVAAWGTAIATSRASRRQEHVSRLWDRRADVYEFVLTVADSWRGSRAETTRLVGHGETSIVAPEPVVDDPEWARSMARLQMYGERRVRAAFVRYGQADKAFVLAFIAWHEAVEGDRKVDRGELPSHEAVGADELVRRRKAVESARDHADAEQEKLITAVAKAVSRMPRYQRRAWRRLKPPAAD